MFYHNFFFLLTDYLKYHLVTTKYCAPLNSYITMMKGCVCVCQASTRTVARGRSESFSHAACARRRTTRRGREFGRLPPRPTARDPRCPGTPTPTTLHPRRSLAAGLAGDYSLIFKVFRNLSYFLS